MCAQHKALIVEDDPAAAAEIAEILKSIDCVSDIVDNKSDALARLRRKKYCIVMLDLEIRLDKDSIKGHLAHGNALLQEIRSRFQQHTGLGYKLPIVVISGFAREKAQALSVLRNGAADVVEKPFQSGVLAQTVLRVLELAGRTTHTMCATLAHRPRSHAEVGKIAVSIPGTWNHRRVTVEVGSRVVGVTHNSLRILLRLMQAKLLGETVHKRKLGATRDHGFKGIARLRRDLELEKGGIDDVIIGDDRGSYGLGDLVSVQSCNAKKLAEIGDLDISSLAQSVHELLKK